MIELTGKSGLAAEIREYLEEQVSLGFHWVVYDSDQLLSSKFELSCFADSASAHAFEKAHQQIFNWHIAVPIGDMIYQLNALEKAELRPDRFVKINNPKTSIKTKTMNLNNLEDRKEEMAALGTSEKTIAKMEELMKTGAPKFTVHQVMPANRGQVDVQFYLQQSSKSEYYFLNKFTVAHSLAKPLEKDQHYLIISPGKDGQAATVKEYDLVTEAVDVFKKREGAGELAVGKDAANKQTLATMEEGKVNFVTKEFRGTFYGKPASQTLWPDRGKGFTVQQAAQMIQGYAVYRNDLVNFLSGEAYSAWVKFDMDKGVGANGNFNLQQYHDPQYGFDLPKVLDNYKIGELAVPEKREKLEADLRNGLTPLVSTEKDGKPVKLLLEAVPRYGKVNFYTPEGKMEKRELFMTKEALAAMLDTGQDKSKNNAKEQEAGMGIGG
ncbi:hypothetical protein OC25_03685 [Pedobacter kyungheensis]|uniref:Uncharacterized protein n=2 Tax=Pedobacter TaxID=84567 RepID=A0A1G6K0D3_9SPHI|nr:MULTISPECIES: hypothetical protein [Pedobacter]KIA96195.1 hypothetical protein OC25_03685 [Pedobacter kyungheensis]SDC24301.1 hypothetical protein SAMN04488024_101610 [Pedobacter soli]